VDYAWKQDCVSGHGFKSFFSQAGAGIVRFQDIAAQLRQGRYGSPPAAHRLITVGRKPGPGLGVGNVGPGEQTSSKQLNRSQAHARNAGTIERVTHSGHENFTILPGLRAPVGRIIVFASDARLWGIHLLDGWRRRHEFSA
jgi:hypothetical protein